MEWRNDRMTEWRRVTLYAPPAISWHPECTFVSRSKNGSWICKILVIYRRTVPKTSIKVSRQQPVNIVSCSCFLKWCKRSSDDKVSIAKLTNGYTFLKIIWLIPLYASFYENPSRDNINDISKAKYVFLKCSTWYALNFFLAEISKLIWKVHSLNNLVKCVESHNNWL
jgi:hypothetical protein